MTHRHLARAAWCAGLVLIAGCAGLPLPFGMGASDAPVAAASAPAPAPAPAPAASAAPPAPPPLVAAPFPEAVSRASKRLFDMAAQNLGTQQRPLIVDPLIDASSGAQTVATSEMGRLLVGGVQGAHPYWQVREFTRDTLAAKPLLLIGTLTAINTKNKTDEASDAFRICLRLIDLQTGKVVARALDRATVDSVNAEQLPLFRDSPTWHKDKTVAGYIKSCQGTPNLGDPIDPLYLMRLPAAAVVNEAQLAYGANKIADANRLFKEAAIVAEPDDLRVLNGLYLTNWRLGKQREAGETFRRIATLGIAARLLPLKILFAPGKAQPVPVPDLQAQYSLWVREVAHVSQAGNACLKVIGHTSRSGSPTANEALSVQRAAYVRERLVTSASKLRGKVDADGVGSRENLIGLGTDDLRDLLDRRVEFRVNDCAAPKAS